MSRDHEAVKLTREGEELMTRFLCSKKAASLVDCFKVSYGLDLLAGNMDEEFKADTAAGLVEAHAALIEYISELESLKVGVK